MPVVKVDEQNTQKQSLTRLERLARRQSSQSIRIAMQSPDFGNVSASSIKEADANFYSPQLSTDFLETPQSQREKRELYRFFYYTNPIVGSAIDFHTDVPMSKIRLSLPKGKDKVFCKKIHQFFQKMGDRVNLFQVLHDITHEYWLQGTVYCFAEDHDVLADMPENTLINSQNKSLDGIDYAGRYVKKDFNEKTLKPDDEMWGNIQEYMKENYQGWQRLQILPPEQVKVEVFQYTNKMQMELLPSEKDRLVVMKAEQQGDPDAMRIASDIPDEIRESLKSGEPIPLNTSPYDDYLCSSFCHQIAHKKSPYDSQGISLLERCIRTLIYVDKLRQAQTSIASRSMTPKRVVWADKLSEANVEQLRDQVDQAIIDPDFSVITNFEIHWDEIGARDRLLDLGPEYEVQHKLLYIGLRITESMLTGESSYSGERIHLDVMNTMYLLYREQIADYVEKQLFAPVAEKKGFWEIDEETGERILLYPKLQFTRLALRDNSEVMDTLFNLYQKGSLPLRFILELLNIDADEVMGILKEDMFTPADSQFNEFIRNALSKAGDMAPEKTDLLAQIANRLGLKMTEESGDRFGSSD